MDIIKKLFTFNEDESCAIGLCKFSEDFYKQEDAKNQVKKRIKKNETITSLLKRSV